MFPFGRRFSSILAWPPSPFFVLFLATLFVSACLDVSYKSPAENANPQLQSTPPDDLAIVDPTPWPDEKVVTETVTPIGDQVTEDEVDPLPTPTAVWPESSDRVPCGVLLPLRPMEPREPVKESPATLSPDVVPEAARPALERILSAPETVGLAAYEIGRESEGIFHNADVQMPLASVSKIINLIAYAEAAAAGELDPAEWIPLSEIERTFLPRSDLGAHQRAVDELEERHLIAHDPPSTPLEEVPWMMIRHSSNAASDYLQLRLGQERIEQTIIDLDLASHTAPCPWIGQFLIMANRQASGDTHRTIQQYLDEPEVYGLEVMRLAEIYANDPDIRDAESSPGWRASLSTQILFSDKLNAQASARDYAGLMARILENRLSSDYANILVRRTLEWPMIFPVNQEVFSFLGLKDGSLPGVLTTAYYAQRAEDGAKVVVVLFFRQLPRGTYQQWRRDLPHDEFARWLLADPAAIPLLREAFTPGT